MRKIRFYLRTDKSIEYANEKGVTCVVQIPRIKTSGEYGDSGIDLSAAYEFTVPPHSCYVVDSFVEFELNPGETGQIWPRGGDMFLIGAGIIDCGYTNTIKVKIVNYTSHPMNFKIGDSIGQLVITRKPDVKLKLEQSDTPIRLLREGDRGDGRIDKQIGYAATR